MLSMGRSVLQLSVARFLSWNTLTSVCGSQSPDFVVDTLTSLCGGLSPGFCRDTLTSL